MTFGFENWNNNRALVAKNVGTVGNVVPTIELPIKTLQKERLNTSLLFLFLQNLFGVVLGVHLVDDAFQNAIFIKYERLAERTHRYLA